jgi:hypothetical protein
MRYGPGHVARASAALLAASLAGGAAAAQELTPRAYWPAPAGTNLLVGGYQRTSGDILIDPSLPIAGVQSRLDSGQLSYVRFFGLLDRTASVQLSATYSSGTTEGAVDGEVISGENSGWSDLRARLTINLRGVPSVGREEFREKLTSPPTIVGASLVIQAPTGEYDPDELLNEGTNRWSIKPAVGVIWPLRPTWLLEFEAGVWLFGENDEFLGATREQDPLYSTEIHLVKRIRPGLWASLDANYYFGGRTSVDGRESGKLQRNSRLGGTITIPFRRRHAIRGSYSTGVVTESGGDFEMLGVVYVYAWSSAG